MNNIALIGFNNALAKNILELMALRGYDKNKVKVFSTNIQKNTKISFGEEDITVCHIDELKPTDFSAVIFTENEKTASLYGVKFAKSKVRIINSTKAFEGDENIPVIVGGINENKLDKASKNIINVPHPFVVEFLSAIAGLAQKYTIKRINLSTYTSVVSRINRRTTTSLTFSLQKLILCTMSILYYSPITPVMISWRLYCFCI